MKIPKQSPLKQIKSNALIAVVVALKQSAFYQYIDCPLWYLRFGKFPKTVIKAKGKEWKQLFDKENFKIGAKFSPEIEIEEYRL